MFRHELGNGTASLVAFMGVLVAAAGLAIGLNANACPDGNPPSPFGDSEAQAAGPDGQVQHNAKVPHPVTISRPVWRQVGPYQEYKGLLEARQDVEVRPAVGSSVDQICFKAGAQVQKGDVLFELDSCLAQAEVEVADAKLAAAHADKMQSEAYFDRIRKVKGAKGGDCTQPRRV
jgi:multidrug efflux pump subunit AcrA (membrane-fusion protein)